MNNDIKTYEYDSEYGGKYIVAPKLATYLENDNIYVGLNFYDEEYTCWDSFSDVTVNIVPMPYLYSAIDTNNNGDSIVDFLEENGFGESTGKYVQSGYCMYPVFRFNEDKLKEIDPDVFADYAKSHGMDKVSLDNKIKNAESKNVFSGNSSKQLDQER